MKMRMKKMKMMVMKVMTKDTIMEINNTMDNSIKIWTSIHQIQTTMEVILASDRLMETIFVEPDMDASFFSF